MYQEVFLAVRAFLFIGTMMDAALNCKFRYLRVDNTDGVIAQENRRRLQTAVPVQTDMYN
jgi:hypothetical protein